MDSKEKRFVKYYENKREYQVTIDIGHDDEETHVSKIRNMDTDYVLDINLLSHDKLAHIEVDVFDLLCYDMELNIGASSMGATTY